MLVAVYATNASAGLGGITDNTANVWTLLPALTDLSVQVQLGYVVNPVITATIITFHSGGTSEISGGAISFLGTAGVPFDKSSHNFSSSATTALDSLSTANTTFANEVLIGYGVVGGGADLTFTTGSGYTNPGSNWSAGSSAPPIYLNYQIVSAQGTYNATQTISVAHSWNAGIATFADTNVPSGTSASIAWLTA